MPTATPLATPTPESELRTFHKFLERFSSQDFHKRVATEFLTYPDRLDEMLQRSLAQCELFQTTDTWHDERGELGLTEQMKGSPDWARRLAVSIAREKNPWPGHGLSFGFVDYEISPFRESGASGRLRHKSADSITGRFDLLLTNVGETQPAPIIVEVKAATDPATTLRTLIQLLAYAVEMGTPHQRVRLNAIYGDAFGTYSEQPQLDLCVMKEVPAELSSKAEKNSTERHEQVQKLCESLLAQPSASRLIRKIIWLHPRQSDSGAFTFEQRFVCTGKQMK